MSVENECLECKEVVVHGCENGTPPRFITKDKWIEISNNYLKYDLTAGDTLNDVLDKLFSELEKQGKEITKLKKLV